MNELENIVKVSNVVGCKVIDINNNHLGKIEEIIINKQTGRVSYVVIGKGSFFGIGGDFFALPWQSLYYEPKKRCYIANANKSDCKTVDDLTEIEWSETDKAWQNALSNYLVGFVF